MARNIGLGTAKMKENVKAQAINQFMGFFEEIESQSIQDHRCIK